MQLVFIHGSGGSSNAWGYQSDFFPGSIAVDLPGHPDGNLLDSIPAMAAWLKNSVEEQGLSDLVLIGHSIGGGVALQYALDYPDDVRALVAVGSGGRLRVHPDTIKFMEKAVANPASIAPMVEGFWENVSKEFASQLVADAMALGPSVFLSDFRACDSFDIMDRLGEIRVPTLAIVGTKDVMTPVKYAKFLVEKMPQATIAIIEGGTHSAFAEFPDDVNAVIDGFLQQLD